MAKTLPVWLVCFLCLASDLRAEEPAAVAPEKASALFNGRDLVGWYPWMKGAGKADPAKAFTVREGVIRVSGEGAGYLATKQAYRDYNLSLEFKWGEKNDGSGNVRNSGLLLNCVEPDGAAGAWPTCIECQLAQGCEGDLIVIRGKGASASLSSETTLASDKKTRWSPGGKKTPYSGKQFWWSKHQPGFEEKLDTRGKDDLASPLGKWTKVEVLQRPGKLTIKINGEIVNEAYDVVPPVGRIALQNEENEILFRNIEIKPLP